MMLSGGLFRLLILSTLTLTTSTTVILLRISRVREEGENAYLASTVVFITECVKLGLCLGALFVSKGTEMIT